MVDRVRRWYRQGLNMKGPRWCISHAWLRMIEEEGLSMLVKIKGGMFANGDRICINYFRGGECHIAERKGQEIVIFHCQKF